LVRGSRTIASRRVKLASGTSTVEVTIPSAVASGAARLHLTLKDTAGNGKSYTRTVHVRAPK
jgi:hypothetical protein